MIFNTDTANSSNLRWLGGAAAILAIPVFLLWWPGCRQYPPVTSREALQVVRLLNSACNTKDAKRLAAAEQRLIKLEQTGKLSANEKVGFEKIMTLAKAGNWERAEEAAFKMAQDQVGVGHADPEKHDHDPHHGHSHPPRKTRK